MPLGMQIYGQDATPEDILEGRLPAPQEFALLYELINKLSSFVPEEVEVPVAAE